LAVDYPGRKEKLAIWRAPEKKRLDLGRAGISLLSAPNLIGLDRK